MEDVSCDVRDRRGMGRPRGLALRFGVGPQLLFRGILINPRSVKRIYALYQVRFLMALVQWWSGVSSFPAASLPRASRFIIPEGPGLDLQVPGLASMQQGWSGVSSFLADQGKLLRSLCMLLLYAPASYSIYLLRSIGAWRRGTLRSFFRESRAGETMIIIFGSDQNLWKISSNLPDKSMHSDAHERGRMTSFFELERLLMVS